MECDAACVHLLLTPHSRGAKHAKGCVRVVRNCESERKRKLKRKELCKGKEKTTTAAKGGDAALRITLTRGVELVGQRAIDDNLQAALERGGCGGGAAAAAKQLMMRRGVEGGATAGAGKTLPLVWDPSLSTAAFARRNRRRPGAGNHRARAFQTHALRAKLKSVALD